LWFELRAYVDPDARSAASSPDDLPWQRMLMFAVLGILVHAPLLLANPHSHLN
jgi:hypothetical protein